MNATQGSPHKGKAGIKRLFYALGYSLEGLGSAFIHEPAFRLELFLALILIPVALLLDVSNLSKALMIATIFLVLVVELFNAAIEATVDRISLERHDLAKRAKDIGSAAVLISLFNVIIVWALIIMQ